MAAVTGQARPIEVAATQRGVDAGGATIPKATVRVLVVTWNRKAFVANLLGSLSRQTYPTGLMDVTVIDNASDDGTLEHLRENFAPEMVVDNTTAAAHEPRFAVRESHHAGPGNRLGFASLTVVRNSANLGGCGGFNTGFAFAEWVTGQERSGGDGRAFEAPDFVWLVDDDADVPSDALANLARVMNSSPDIGLVGSRTVNIADKRTTIETTIFYNRTTGGMQDDCPPGNPKQEAWARWVKDVGGTRGARDYSGQIDVDVVSACSMLARWSAALGTADPRKPAVGFWDWRYFIYCDDADWCLRFAKAGWRVVLSLDAVVYHTPWNLKLTPARIYYANRNKVWMGQKVLEGQELRSVTVKAMRSILRDSLHAAWHRRLFHAHIILDTARDIAIGRAGKTGSDGPVGEPVFDGMRRLGLLRSGAVVAVLCPHADAMKWAEALRGHVQGEVDRRRGEGEGGIEAPEFRLIVRDAVLGTGGNPAGVIVYGGRRASKIKKQLHVLKARPHALVVFDQTNDFPVLSWGGWNLHIDQKKPTIVQVERDGWAARTKFLIRWLPNAARCLWFARTVRPHKGEGRYG